VIATRASDALPDWAPSETTGAVLFSGIGPVETLDFIANARLEDRFTQTFLEMSVGTDIAAKTAGIEKPLPLPPGHFVSAHEAHADIGLSEILGYDVVADREEPAGLRLAEWVRGYAALQCLARTRRETVGTSGLLTVVGHDELVAMLQRVGLAGARAQTFIMRASLSRASRDLFDQPLLKLRDGSFLVFGPSLLKANLAQVTLSAIGNLRQTLSRKGKAFERRMRAFFDEKGMKAHSFKTTIDGEQYEFDAIVEWDGRVFLFECKNVGLSGNSPIQAYYFDLEQQSAVRQVQRQAKALRAHPEVLRARTGIELAGKSLIPCVLNSLPYQPVDEVALA